MTRGAAPQPLPGPGPAKGTDAAAAATTIAPALLAWYDRARRDLPWRRRPSAYGTLVSEFMLQQTVVAAVIPHFERFLQRFPDLPALAAAPDEMVLAAWSGLGYYARARNLHRAARAIAQRHGGQIPDQEDALRGLPGIGPYTAAAVAAIAFGRRTFALDGNAARVVSRLVAESAPIDRPATRSRLHAVGLSWVPARRAGDFAQAVMELGATVCVPRRPACDLCPVARSCAAYGLGRTAEIPVKPVRALKKVVRVSAVRIRAAGRVLLVRSDRGLLAGTWMLPAAEVGDGEPPLAAARAVLRGVGLPPMRLRSAGAIRHLFTHRDVTVEVFDGACSACPPPPALRPARGAADSRDRKFAGETQESRVAVWVDDARLDEMAVSTFLRKQLALKGDKAREPP